MVFTALLVVACITDVRSRRIPNWLVLILATTGLVFSIASAPVWPGVLRGLGGLALGFTIWILFYVAGGMGAGDVKLFAAAAAWLGPAGAWRASLVAALVGGVLSLLALLIERRAREGIERVAASVSMFSLAPLGKATPGGDRKRYLPYGVALALGALLTAWIPWILSY